MELLTYIDVRFTVYNYFLIDSSTELSQPTYSDSVVVTIKTTA